MRKSRMGLGVLLAGVIAAGTWSSNVASGATVTTAAGRGGDTFVYEYQPDNNFGWAATVGTSGDIYWGYNQTAYLRFDLAGLLGPNEEFASATLWLNGSSANSPTAGYQYLGVYGLDDGCAEDGDGAWYEWSMNWNNQPTTAGTLLDAVQTFTGLTSGWQSFSDTRLVDFLNADTNDLASIRLKRIDDKGSVVRFYSKDHEDKQLMPYLEYTTRLKDPVVSFPGDANNDGMVDVGDLGILAGNYGTDSGATWAMGDFNNDGAVDVGDLGILAGNYGTSAASAASVPEPMTLGLLSLGGLALLRKSKSEN